MSRNGAHETAIDIESLNCVNRVDTGKDQLTVVFDLNNSGYGEFNEQLDPEHYNAVLDKIESTVFQEEPPCGHDKVEVYPQKDELHLSFVV